MDSHAEIVRRQLAVVVGTVVDGLGPEVVIRERRGARPPPGSPLGLRGGLDGAGGGVVAWGRETYVLAAGRWRRHDALFPFGDSAAGGPAGMPKGPFKPILFDDAGRALTATAGREGVRVTEWRRG